MNTARYFLPDHPELTDVYSKADLRAMLQSGELSRSDIVTDDETGLSHLLGDLVTVPFPGTNVLPSRSTSPLLTPAHESREFRADTPLPHTEAAVPDDLESEDDGDPIYDDEPVDEDEDEQSASEDDGPPHEDDEPPVDDEEVMIYIGHPSWLAYPRALLVASLCIATAHHFHQRGVGFEWITLLGSVAGLILVFIGLERTTTTYSVTSRRVELEFGIIGRNTKEVRICDIRAIDVVQRTYGALMGIGTVKFDSSAGEGPEVFFQNVRRPHRIKQLVRELQA